jgi:glycosyltransferase involved in cell wall biosynthesis
LVKHEAAIVRKKVSIIVLVHNGLKYCRITFNSLRKTSDVDYEVIVVDNDSGLLTKAYLLFVSIFGKRISRLCYLNTNTWFSEGNNVGSRLVSKDSDLILFLNSDIKIRHPSWLSKLLDIHEKGISAYGVVGNDHGLPSRADGYCLMIDKELFYKYHLDETFKFWWATSKLQAEVLRDGYSVKAVKRHSHLLFHYGGGSGKAPKKYLELDEKYIREWSKWYKTDKLHIIDSIEVV